MSLHHTHTLHASGPNNSDDRRIGLTLSYIPAHVRPKGLVQPTALSVRGEDRYGFYRRETRLKRPLSPEAREAHAQATGVYTAVAGIAS